MAEYELEATRMKDRIRQLEKENSDLKQSQAAHPCSPIFVETEVRVLKKMRIKVCPKKNEQDRFKTGFKIVVSSIKENPKYL